MRDNEVCVLSSRVMAKDICYTRGFLKAYKAFSHSHIKLSNVTILL